MNGKKKILKTAGNAATALIVIVTLALLVSHIAGIRTYVITSGSMEPAYHVGSLVYVEPKDPEEIKEGDVITFALSEETTATHRVVEVNREEQWFKTKGDANDHEDAGHVIYKNVFGVAKFSVPYAGYIANFIQHPPGTYVTIALCVTLLVFTFVPDMLAKKGETFSEEGAANEKETD